MDVLFVRVGISWKTPLFRGGKKYVRHIFYTLPKGMKTLPQKADKNGREAAGGLGGHGKNRIPAADGRGDSFDSCVLTYR